MGRLGRGGTVEGQEASGGAGGLEESGARAVAAINGDDTIGGQKGKRGAAGEATGTGEATQACAAIAGLPGHVTGEAGRSCHGRGGGWRKRRRHGAQAGIAAAGLDGRDEERRGAAGDPGGVDRARGARRHRAQRQPASAAEWPRRRCVRGQRARKASGMARRGGGAVGQRRARLENEACRPILSRSATGQGGFAGEAAPHSGGALEHMARMPWCAL
uniref:Uncharacterized protein n=1 Tax=Setaria viridis TaxID=4556 RepID=A0A4U6V058_SETVI|nr:hypothetical protein SEVIR_4G226800v2 [Setaria viridis]